jgi:amino acid transporter
VQYLALAIFVVAALWEFFAGNAPAPTPFDWNWLNPFAFTDYHGFTEAVLLALFIYWGWDSCLALNEETKDPKRIPGARPADHRHPAVHLRLGHDRRHDVRRAR